jgi:[ribosomal protein S18]-alanine N-acetyltransferase
MTRTSVRVPQPGDVRSLAEAEGTCFADPWPGQLFASEVLAPGRFHRMLVDPSGNLVAYLLSTWQYLDLHVLKVATMPEYRRQGLARRLMELAESHAVEMGGETVTLEVRESNRVAFALYLSIGFALVGRRKAYYMDGEDALVMTKRLPV